MKKLFRLASILPCLDVPVQAVNDLSDAASPLKRAVEPEGVQISPIHGALHPRQVVYGLGNAV